MTTGFDRLELPKNYTFDHFAICEADDGFIPRPYFTKEPGYNSRYKNFELCKQENVRDM